MQCDETCAGQEYSFECDYESGSMVAGCNCEEGLVLDIDMDECVAPEKCPPSEE